MKTRKLCVASASCAVRDLSAHFTTIVGDNEVLLDIDPDNFDPDDGPDWMHESGPGGDACRQLIALVNTAMESGADYLLLTP